jgi:hypothetical protein
MAYQTEIVTGPRGITIGTSYDLTTAPAGGTDGRANWPKAPLYLCQSLSTALAISLAAERSQFASLRRRSFEMLGLGVCFPSEHSRLQSPLHREAFPRRALPAGRQSQWDLIPVRGGESATVPQFSETDHAIAQRTE